MVIVTLTFRFVSFFLVTKKVLYFESLNYQGFVVYTPHRDSYPNMSTVLLSTTLRSGNDIHQYIGR